MTVEGALVAAPLLMLILAVIEAGFLLSSVHAVSNSANAGARAGSVWGDQASSDYEILRAVDRGVAGMLHRDVNYVVVYKSDASASDPSDSCRSGVAVAGQCNVYRPADFSRPVADFGCRSTSALDGYWCPTGRSTALTASAGGPPDYVGVFVSAEHRTVSGLIGRSKTVTQKSVVRLEPRRV